MANFTPGPWKRVESRITEDGENLITDSYQMVESGNGYLDNDEGGTNQGFCLSACMNIADANLIAAAPEMYFELHRALAVIRSPQSFDVDAVCADIERLLAKADGRAQ